MILSVLAVLCVIPFPSLNAYRIYKPSEVTHKKAEDGFSCIEELTCYQRRPTEFSEMIPSNCTELEALIYSEVADKIQEKYQDPPKVFLDTFADKFCTQTVSERTEHFKDSTIKVSEDFKMNNCEIEESDICICYFLWFENVEKIIDYWTEQKVCGNPQKMGENAKEESSKSMTSFG